MRLLLLVITSIIFNVSPIMAADSQDPAGELNPYVNAFVASKATNAKLEQSSSEPQLFSGKDKVADKHRMEELGFELLGYSDFQAGNVSPEMALQQARKIRADRVLLYSERVSKVPSHVKLQQLKDAKQSGQPQAESDAIYKYFATYWAKLVKPSLGVHVKVPSKEEPAEGLQVLVVIDGSPAQAAGLKKGDSLISIGDVQLLGINDLSQAVKQYAGQTVELVYVRNTMRQQEKLTLN
jgi:hypothetical protein